MEVITKMIPIQYIKTEKGDFRVNEVLEILENLEDTDSGFNTLNIFNNNLEDWFIENKVIKKTTRGSVCRAENYEFFNEIIWNLVYKEK